MPTVPTLDNFRTTPSGGQGRRLAAPQVQGLGAAPQFRTQQAVLPQDIRTNEVSPTLLNGVRDVNAGAQAMDIARATGSISSDLGKVAEEIAQQANATRVNDALNVVRERAMSLQYDPDNGYQRVKGRDAILDADGRPRTKPLAEDYTSQLNDTINDIGSKLTNPAQQQAYRQRATEMEISFRGAALAHENQEYKTYQTSVAEGTIGIESRRLVTSFQDPRVVADATANIKAAVFSQAKQSGYSATWAEDKAFTLVSGAHKDAIAAALEAKNLTLANAYLTAHAKEMSPDDLLVARTTVKDQTDTAVGTQAGLEVVTKAIDSSNPTDFRRMVGITRQAESGGRERDAQGRLITSAEGAQGAMQVMPKTNLAPGFGVKPAKDNSDAERTRVGEDYLAAMLHRYGGDPQKAWAAYNWGPGSLDKALKEHGPDWLDHAPAETQNYVANNTRAYAEGAGATPQPTLAEVHAPLYADAYLSKNPKALASALETSTKVFNDNKAAVAQKQDEAQGRAIQLMDSGVGYEQLPPDLRQSLKPQDIPMLRNFAKSKAEGDVVTKPAVYLTLSDPTFLHKLTKDQLMNYRPHLSASDFKHFSDQWADKGNTSQAAGTLNMPALNSAVDNHLLSIGINPKPKASDQESSAHVGAIQQFLQQKLILAQQAKGRKFDDAETATFVDQQFATNLEFRQKTVFGISDGTTSKNMLSMQFEDIPEESVAKIKSYYVKRGVAKPTDSQVLSAYWRIRAPK